MSLPDGLISYGSDANCTLALCPIEASVLEYQPSIPASAVFIALFSVALIVHTVEGILWRQTLNSFAIPIILGCIDEIIGYVGRIILNDNPFSFSGFLMQIICITTAPVFFCAAIYVTLARTITTLDVSLARFNPKFLYWVFIPCDIISLVFQAVGGALSSTGNDSNDVGVNLSLFGLAFQVFMLVLFVAASSDYLVRFALRNRRTDKQRETGQAGIPKHLRIYLIFIMLAIVLILIRCIFRIDELSEGYDGDIFHNEGLFYGLESVMIVVAVFCLTVGHPGYGLQRINTQEGTSLSILDPESGSTTDQAK